MFLTLGRHRMLIVAKSIKWHSAHSLGKTCIAITFEAGTIRHLCLQIGSWIMLAYLICPSVHNFFKHFRKQEPELNFSLNGFFYRGDLTGKL